MPTTASEIAVVGGGPAGLAAAIAAARGGARTLLLERHPVLGGMGTAALVNNFCNAHKAWVGRGRPCRLIIGGIFAELRRRLTDRRAIVGTDLLAGNWMESYDPVVFAAEAAALCRAAGVEVRHGWRLQQADFTAGSPARLVGDDGAEVRAAAVVDASGDAVVAARAGVPCTFGRPGDGAVMPLTMCYRIGPIDLAEVRRQHRLTGAEIVAGTQHEDVIAQCCYGVDIHDPRSTGQTLRPIGGPGHYDIPLRCLVPRDGPGNLLVAGRCLSADHEAMSSLRVAPSCMATGEAAGVAAVLAVQRGLAVQRLPAAEVQARLRATGSILD